MIRCSNHSSVSGFCVYAVHRNSTIINYFFYIHHACHGWHMYVCRVDIDRFRFFWFWRRRAGRMKLTNKQRCLAWFSSFSTAAHPQSDHYVPNLRHQRRRRHCLAPSNTPSFLLTAASATASQASRYVLYIMRRRNKLSSFCSIGRRRI
jgi:hypothetical protein